MGNILAFLKKQTPAFYLFCIGALFTIVAFIVSAISYSGPGYGYSEFWIVILASITALLLLAGVVTASVFLGDRWWLSLLMILAVALLGVCFYLMVAGKTNEMGGVWFSDMDRGNKPTEASLAGGVAGMVFYLLAAFCVSAGAFFKTCKRQ